MKAESSISAPTGVDRVHPVGFLTSPFKRMMLASSCRIGHVR